MQQPTTFRGCARTDSVRTLSGTWNEVERAASSVFVSMRRATRRNSRLASGRRGSRELESRSVMEQQ